jgi:hypothetical protein
MRQRPPQPTVKLNCKRRGTRESGDSILGIIRRVHGDSRISRPQKFRAMKTESMLASAP